MKRSSGSAAHGVTFGRFRLLLDGWLVSSCGVCSMDSIPTTGSRSRRLVPASAKNPDSRRRRAPVFYVATRPDAIYVLHAFEKKTQKTSARDLQVGRDRFGVLKKLGQQHGKEKRR